MSLFRELSFKKTRQPAVVSIVSLLPLTVLQVVCWMIVYKVISALEYSIYRCRLSLRFDGTAEDLGHSSRAKLAGYLR